LIVGDLHAQGAFGQVLIVDDPIAVRLSSNHPLSAKLREVASGIRDLSTAPLLRSSDHRRKLARTRTGLLHQ
jgi:hypothetical protein